MMNDKINGGYVKAENIRRVINTLSDIRFDKDEDIMKKEAVVHCLINLEIISDDQAQFLFDMYKRIKA